MRMAWYEIIEDYYYCYILSCKYSPSSRPPSGSYYSPWRSHELDPLLCKSVATVFFFFFLVFFSPSKKRWSELNPYYCSGSLITRHRPCFQACLRGVVGYHASLIPCVWHRRQLRWHLVVRSWGPEFDPPRGHSFLFVNFFSFWKLHNRTHTEYP